MAGVHARRRGRVGSLLAGGRPAVSRPRRRTERRVRPVATPLAVGSGRSLLLLTARAARAGAWPARQNCCTTFAPMAGRAAALRLFGTPTSPYARIARIAVAELQLESEVELVWTATRQPNDPSLAFNPSGRALPQDRERPQQHRRRQQRRASRSRGHAGDRRVPGRPLPASMLPSST